MTTMFKDGELEKLFEESNLLTYEWELLKTAPNETKILNFHFVSFVYLTSRGVF